MSDVTHGANANKIDSGVITPAVVDTGVHFVVGTAPVHMVGGKVNEVIMVERCTIFGGSFNAKKDVFIIFYFGLLFVKFKARKSCFKIFVY